MVPEHFDALSDEELLAVADKMGLRLPRDLARPFVLEEILDALEDEGLERRSGGASPLVVEECKCSCREREAPGASEPQVLPRRYNETMIRAIPRDPSWAFAFWDIADTEAGIAPGEDGESPLFLRVTELGPAKVAPASRDPERRAAEHRAPHFDIPVSAEDFQWYVNLPHPKSRYRIELCARVDGRAAEASPPGAARFRVLARTEELAVPRQRLDRAPESLGAAEAELLRLSGLGELHIEAPTDDNPQRILKLEPGCE